MDAAFLGWFLNQSTTQRILQAQLRYNSDFGTAECWCGAAEQWAGQHAKLVGERGNVSRPVNRPSCMVVTVPLIHDDAHTQNHGRTGEVASDVVYRGFKVLRSAGLRFTQSRINKDCHGRNCTPHAWWRYAPKMGWRLPESDVRIRMVRACAVTQLSCPLAADASSVSVSTIGPANGSGACGGLTDLHWDENPWIARRI